MKTLFLTIVIIGAFGIYGFAQGVIPRSVDPDLKLPVLPKISENNFLSDSLLFNDMFTAPFEINKNILPDPTNSLFDFRREIRPVPLPDQQPIDRMPIMKPEGNFAMRYYKPDPSIHFTILKKEFK